MKWSASSFSLALMTFNHKSLILKWRNADSIRYCMYNTSIISDIEHDNWFSREVENCEARHLIFYFEDIPIGYVAFTEINMRDFRCAWAYNLADNREGLPKGVGAIMEYYAIEYAFNVLGVKKLCCEVLDFNSSVIRLHQKFGFSEEGVLVNHIVRPDGVFNVHLLALFEEKWRCVKNIISEKLFVSSWN